MLQGQKLKSYGFWICLIGNRHPPLPAGEDTCKECSCLVDIFLLGACMLLNQNLFGSLNKWQLLLHALAGRSCFRDSPLKLLFILTSSMQMLEAYRSVGSFSLWCHLMSQLVFCCICCRTDLAESEAWSIKINMRKNWYLFLLLAVGVSGGKKS
jgi:hypothetical protein